MQWQRCQNLYRRPQSTSTSTQNRTLLVCTVDGQEYSRAKHCLGNLFGNEYEQKLNEVKTKFGRAKENFDRSIRAEVFKAVLQNGADVLSLSSCFLSCSLSVHRIGLAAGDPLREATCLRRR